jgi:hypothetical protein
MEMIVPIPLALTYTYSSSVSVYDNWDSGTDYNKGQIVHDAIADGGDGQDYQAQAYISAGGSRPSASSVKYWAVAGITASDALSYQSDADLSEYDTWTSGAAVPKGLVQVDLADRSDYIATVALTTGENIIRPSVAVLSDDADIAARWVKVGTANAFRMFDGLSNTRTRADSTLTCTALAHGLADRVCFVGLREVKDVDVTVVAGEKFANPSFDSPVMTGWEGTWTKAAGSISITTGNTASLLMSVVPGRNYRFAVTFSSNTGTVTALTESPAGTLIESANSSASSGTVNCDFEATMTIQRMEIALSGGGATITAVSLKETGFTTENLSADQEYTEGGEYKSIVSLSHEPLDSPQYTITLASEYQKTEIGCGLVVCGVAEGLAVSEADVTHRSTDYSRVEFDEEFGTPSLLQRGYSRTLSVAMRFPEGYGAYAFNRLMRVRALPCFWDLNEGNGDDGLLVHGIAQQPTRTISGFTGVDQIRLELTGLVE